jgi:hypothetical protein
MSTASFAVQMSFLAGGTARRSRPSTDGISCRTWISRSGLPVGLGLSTRFSDESGKEAQRKMRLAPCVHVASFSAGTEARKPEREKSSMPFAVFELLYVCVAAGFIVLVILGHALLFGALYKCAREDWAPGRRSDRKPPVPDAANVSPVAPWSTGTGSAHDLPGRIPTGRKASSDVLPVT